MKETKIEWCDSTINGSSGCDGCELWSGETRTCYAGQMHESRLAKSLPRLYAESFSEVRMIPGRFQRAADWPDLTGKWRTSTGKDGVSDKPWLDDKPRHIFVGDMGDTFSKAVTDEYLKRELIGAIESKNGQRHIWQILTKQIKRLADFSEMLGGLPDNVVAMTTVTNQRTADVRVPHLLRTKCKTRGVSAEPLLGGVDLSRYMWPVCWSIPMKYRSPEEAEADGATVEWHRQALVGAHVKFLDWVICGGESGYGARPMHPEWAKSLRDQATRAGAAFFFKQWGQWSPVISRDVWTESDPLVCVKPDGETSFWCGNEDTTTNYSENYEEGDVPVERVGKKNAGRLLDGREWNEMPTLKKAA